MLKTALCAIALLLAATPSAAARREVVDVSPDERRWLAGAWPVVAWARAAGMPLDVVVQPQTDPDAPPLALAYVDGRCKLVFTMRGNPAVAATVRGIDPALLDTTLELMAAHELGHCRRWIDGHWHDLPAGFDGRDEGHGAGQLDADVQAERREEGYADLVGLAWTRLHHPQHYAAVHAWLLRLRADAAATDVYHDTADWVQLAAPHSVPAGGSIFDVAARLWQRGLTTAE